MTDTPETALLWLPSDGTYRTPDRLPIVPNLLHLEAQGLCERHHPDPWTNAAWRLTAEGVRVRGEVMETVVQLAECLARHAHKDQADRSGAPYIGHVERVVASLLRRWPDATEDEIAAAWLHDVIEDTEWDAHLLLKAGISPAAVAIVQEVSRPAGSTYLAWIQSLSALGSLSAVKVKLADNEDNTSPDRVASIPEGESMLRKRYLPARAMLEARLLASSSDRKEQ